ncbi:hypothetical protein ACG7TL_005288 [Trametes sanguinea]
MSFWRDIWTLVDWGRPYARGDSGKTNPLPRHTIIAVWKSPRVPTQAQSSDSEQVTPLVRSKRLVDNEIQVEAGRSTTPSRSTSSAKRAVMYSEKQADKEQIVAASTSARGGLGKPVGSVFALLHSLRASNTPSSIPNLYTGFDNLSEISPSRLKYRLFTAPSERPSLRHLPASFWHLPTEPVAVQGLQGLGSHMVCSSLVNRPPWTLADGNLFNTSAIGPLYSPLVTLTTNLTVEKFV